MKAIHNPLNTFPCNTSHTPTKIKPKPKNRPVLAAISVARRKFLFAPQTMTRTTRPPSSGNPGIRQWTLQHFLRSAGHAPRKPLQRM